MSPGIPSVPGFQFVRNLAFTVYIYIFLNVHALFSTIINGSPDRDSKSIDHN